MLPRFTLACFLLFGIIGVQAQDYRLFRTDQGYFFDQPTFNHPDWNQVITAYRMDSIVASGTDSILNSYPILQKVPGDYCRDETFGWAKSTIEAADGTVYLLNHRDDTITWRTTDPIGTSWMFLDLGNGHQIQATVDTITDTTLLGNADSLKWISLTHLNAQQQVVADPVNSVQLSVSKAHGMVHGVRFFEFPDVIKPLVLVGADQAQSGVTVPTGADIYDFAPGDEFHFNTYWGTGGTMVQPWLTDRGWTKWKIVSRDNSTPGKSTYIIDVERHITRTIEYSNGPWQTEVTDTTFQISETYDNVNDAFGPVFRPELALCEFECFSNRMSMGHNTTWNAQEIRFEDGNVDSVFHWSDSCYMPAGWLGISEYKDYYAVGLGRIYSSTSYGSSDQAEGSSWTLVYYDKGGVTWGNPVSVTEQPKPEAFNLFPNPTQGPITLTDLPTGLVVWQVMDVQGRAVIQGQQTLLGAPLQLDVSALADGWYVVRLETEAGLLTRPIIKQP